MNYRFVIADGALAAESATVATDHTTTGNVALPGKWSQRMPW